MSYSLAQEVCSSARVECRWLGNRTRSEPMPGVASACPDRVATVRQQLANGTYNLDGHLDAILEKVLVDIAVRTRDKPQTKQVGKDRSVGGRVVKGQHDCVQ